MPVQVHSYLLNAYFNYFFQVKITYIASEKEEKVRKSDNAGAFKKFIALVEKISKEEILADIQTAKDGLLNRTLKGQRKDRRLL